MPKKRSNVLRHFKNIDPKIHAVMLSLNFDDWLEPYQKRNSGGHFLALCRAIVGQQLSGKAANSIFKKFSDSFKGKEITPKAILKKTDQQLRDLGLSWAKVRYIKDLAENVLAGNLVLESIHELVDDEVIAELIKIKGIGNWTAEMFLLFTLGREDVFSLGDLGLKKGIEKVYGKKSPSARQMEKITSKWKPYRSFGTIALWYSLEMDE